MVTGWGELQDSYQTSADFEVPRFSCTLLFHTPLAHCNTSCRQTADCTLSAQFTLSTVHTSPVSALFDTTTWILCSAMQCTWACMALCPRSSALQWRSAEAIFQPHSQAGKPKSTMSSCSLMPSTLSLNPITHQCNVSEKRLQCRLCIRLYSQVCFFTTT